MIHATRLTEETVPRFIENIKNRVPMVCWVYYDWRDGTEKSIDISYSRYRDPTSEYTAYVSLSCRGVEYFAICEYDGDIDKFPVAFWMNHIYSFIEVEKD